jgi:hypothetical protein
MNVGLIELATHNEVLDSLIRQAVDAGWTTSIYTNEFCYNSSSFRNSEQVIWHVCVGSVSLSTFISSNRDSILANEHVVVTTITSHSLELFEHKQKFTSFHCIVHNLNGSRALRYTKGLLTDILLNSESVSVVAPDQCLLMADDRTWSHCINIAYPQYLSPPFDRDEVFGCVPGRIYDGRAYDQLIAALTIAAPKLDRTLNLELLGEMGGGASEEIRKFKEETQSVRLHLHDQFVDQKTFDQSLLMQDFRILPITRTILRGGQIEERGKSCISGNINDMVRFGLPAIIPKFYPLSHLLEEIVERYESTETMATAIVEWVNLKTFNVRKRNMADPLLKYKDEALRVLRQQFGARQTA